MNIIIILSVLSSLLNDFFVRQNPLLGNATSIVSILLIMLAFINILRKKTLKKYGKIYIILYLNIILFVAQVLFIEFNSYLIKLSIYIVTIIVLINYLNDKTMSLLYKLIIIISIILSVDIIIQGINLISTGVNLRNVRHYTLLDKQGYNMFYSFAIPIIIVNTYYNKNMKNIFILISSIIAVIFIMQIKSFIYTIPLGIIGSLWLLKIIKLDKVIKYIGGLAIIFILIFSLYPNIIPEQIVMPIRYFVLNDTSNMSRDDLKNLDTFIMRGEIWENSFNLVKDKPILGIGYGNYSKFAENKNIISQVTGISYEMPNVTESGLLTFILEGGLLGFSLHMLIIFWICLNTLRIKEYSKNTIIATMIFVVFIFSNIVQDNLNYLYWFVLAAQIYNTKKSSAVNYVKEYIS